MLHWTHLKLHLPLYLCKTDCKPNNSCFVLLLTKVISNSQNHDKFIFRKRFFAHLLKIEFNIQMSIHSNIQESQLNSMSLVACVWVVLFFQFFNLRLGWKKIFFLNQISIIFALFLFSLCYCLRFLLLFGNVFVLKGCCFCFNFFHKSKEWVLIFWFAGNSSVSVCFLFDAETVFCCCCCV